MSGPTPDAKRKFLSDWLDSGDTVYVISEAYPNCTCETAAAADGGFGEVRDQEFLRLFIVSRTNFDLKSKKPKAKPSLVEKAFRDGVSVYRVDHATATELEFSAQLIYKGAVKSDPDYGGIVGVCDFCCASVRKIAEIKPRDFCVLETPLDPVLEGGYKRPSHADIVHAGPALDDKTRLALRMVLFNTLYSPDSFKNALSIRDCDLSRFTAKAI